jgi:hypothetical protein
MLYYACPVSSPYDLHWTPLALVQAGKLIDRSYLANFPEKTAERSKLA